MAGMTKRELIQALQDDPTDMDAPVRICYNYGDRGQNVVAAKVGSIEETPIRYSEYHKSDVVIDEDRMGDEPTFACCIFTR